MADRRDDLDAAFAGADGPRALPADVADALVGSLTGAAAGDPVLTGIDRARPIPEELRVRLTATVAGVTTLAARRRRQHRALSIAAAFLLVVGIAASATLDGDGDGETATAPDVTSTTIGLHPQPQVAPATTAPPEVLPGDPGEGVVVALAESDPQYARLGSFSDCDDLLTWVRDRAVEEVTPYGLEGSGGGGGVGGTSGGSGAVEGANPVSGPGQPVSLPSTGASSAVDQTNVQETGVDQPDLVEVGSGALFVLTSTEVRAVLTGDGGAVAGGSVGIAEPNERPVGMLRDGDRLLVLTSARIDNRMYTGVRTIDIADPTALAVVDSTLLDGGFIDARLAAGTLHVVTSWAPGPFAFTYPASGSFEDQAAALTANRQLLADSELGQWVPPSLECTQVLHPRDLAGFSTTVVTSIPAGDLHAGAHTGLLADAGTVYATASTLVVSTTRWEYRQQGYEGPVDVDVRTNVHRFALDPAGPAYVASGSVPGYLRSSYALDEDQAGNLRIAATEQPPWDADAAAGGMSSITVLATDGEVLVPIGYLGGLGDAGEQIAGIRFVDDVAFVVTFRQVDPLYVVDLSDPRDLRLRGSLHVTGFSSYLHPLGGGLLLGVGRETDEAGTPTGSAVSIYDVSNPDEPALSFRAVHPEAGVRFEAQFEPLAFLLSEDTSQVVLPANGSNADFSQRFAEFDVYTLTPGGIAHVARVSHDDQVAEPVMNHAYRAAMIGGVLYTVSSAGVMASDSSTFAVQGWVPFPLGPATCCFAGPND